MDYKEAKEIRKEYPRRLTEKNIQEILSRWEVKEGGHEQGMFSFACSPRTDGKLNISELKLWFLYNNKCHFEDIKKYNDHLEGLPLHKSYGHLIAMWCDHIIDGGEYEKVTQKLRIEMLKQLLNGWKDCSNFFIKQKHGVQEILDIKNRVHAKYPEYHLPSSFPEQCYKLIQDFINE